MGESIERDIGNLQGDVRGLGHKVDSLWRLVETAQANSNLQHSEVMQKIDALTLADRERRGNERTAGVIRTTAVSFITSAIVVIGNALISHKN